MFGSNLKKFLNNKIGHAKVWIKGIKGVFPRMMCGNFADESDNFDLKTAQEFTKTQNFNATTLSDASTIAWDASSNQVAKVTLGGNRILGAATNQVDGAVYVLTVIQDGSGSRTLSFNSNYKLSLIHISEPTRPERIGDSG